MSVARGVPGPDGPRAGQKTVLPRSDELWTIVQTEWAGENRTRWKALAMLHLQVVGGWTLSMIGKAYGQHRGRVSRLIASAKAGLADTFAPPPEPLGPFQDDDMPQP